MLEDVEDGVGCRHGSPRKRPMWLGSIGLARAVDSAESEQPGESRLRARCPQRCRWKKVSDRLMRPRGAYRSGVFSKKVQEKLHLLSQGSAAGLVDPQTRRVLDEA